ncbi:MAG: sulfate reduction electron transfer complex DsrMKJOP subunit DsrJ [Planctomycetota bacterium]
MNEAMNDMPKIVAGIVIFLVLVLFPIWFTTAAGDFTPPDLGDVKKITGEEDCVRDVEWMRANHMDLLDCWRDDVVRHGNREDEKSGEEMSLTRTCLHCHSGEGRKANFCDRCHDYVGTKPNCWDCHIDPEAE